MAGVFVRRSAAQVTIHPTPHPEHYFRFSRVAPFVWPKRYFQTIATEPCSEAEIRVINFF